jgi:hypothetical protein
MARMSATRAIIVMKFQNPYLPSIHMRTNSTPLNVSGGVLADPVDGRTDPSSSSTSTRGSESRTSGSASRRAASVETKLGLISSSSLRSVWYSPSACSTSWLKWIDIGTVASFRRKRNGRS